MLDALIKDNVIVDELIREKIKLLNDEITINNVYNNNENQSNVFQVLYELNLFRNQFILK